MSYRVFVAAKRPGAGTISKEFSYIRELDDQEMRRLREEAIAEFLKVYGTVSSLAGSPVAVDITVRRVDS